jgi:hypothetical protein
MGKDRDLAMSVPWADLQAAIEANPQRGSGPHVTAGTASASLAVLPTDGPGIPWLPAGWTEDTTFTVGDIVSFALWVRDPLYRNAQPSVRRTMEMEEATALLQASEVAWKEKNGRMRGWVRKHLEEDLRARASGGDPAPDAWEAPRTQRRAALLVDYVCVMRGLRCGLWWPEQGIHTLFPLTGGSDPVAMLNATTGHMLVGPTGFRLTSPEWVILSTVAADKSKWTPPASAPAVGATTVAQIQERIREERGSNTDDGVTGNRTALWSYLQWLTLKRDLAANVTAATSCPQ